MNKFHPTQKSPAKMQTHYTHKAHVKIKKNIKLHIRKTIELEKHIAKH